MWKYAANLNKVCVSSLIDWDPENRPTSWFLTLKDAGMNETHNGHHFLSNQNDNKRVRVHVLVATVFICLSSSIVLHPVPACMFTKCNSIRKSMVVGACRVV